jgi:hypothetical protein
MTEDNGGVLKPPPWLWDLLKPAIVAMIVALLVSLGARPPGQVASQGVSHFSSVYASGDVQAVDDLIAGDDATVADDITCDAITAADVAASDDLTVADDATVGGGLAISGAGTVGSFFNVSAATAISCTDGGVITMTGTYQPLQSAGTVTPTLSTTATGVTTGTWLCLINTADTTINLADSGTAKLGGARALGQYDSLWLVFDGTNWVEISTTNN